MKTLNVNGRKPGVQRETVGGTVSRGGGTK